MWFWKIIRRFFMSLDTVLFNFIGTLYDLLLSISRTSVLSQGDIAEFARRIELLLGIFMLFKLSFSLITYIVNPEDFSSKEKGFGKLIQNGVVSLVLLVVVPYIFSMAYNLQAKVLEGNILGRLIFEDEESSNSIEGNSYLSTAGEDMAFTLMLPFFKPNVGINKGTTNIDLSECVNLYESTEGEAKFNSKCQSALSNAEMDSVNLLNYVNGIEKKSLGLTFRANTAIDTVGKDDDEEFIINYMAPLSTVVAVIVCLLLVTFCIDIGLRSIKLAFLQLVYPIPVIAYMDPKGGKDGIFKKWYQMCFSTYLSLFLRLLALYFGIYIISKLSSGAMYDIINGSQITNGWIMIFIIIGVLMFIKQLPTILKNLGINIEGDGKFTLNPLKKIEEGALGGKTISRLPKAAAGAAMGLGIGAVGMATGAGIGKAFTGMASGLAGGLKGKKLGEIHKGQIDANQRLREARSNGSTFLGRRGAQISGLIGSRGALGSIENEISNYESQKEQIENKIAPVKQKINQANETVQTLKDIDNRAIERIKQGKGVAGDDYLKAMKYYEKLKGEGRFEEAEQQRQSIERDLNGRWKEAYIDDVLKNNITDDDTMNNLIETYKTNGKISGHYQDGEDLTAKSLGDKKKEINNEISSDKNRIRNEEVQISEIDDQIKAQNERKRKASADKNAVKH